MTNIQYKILLVDTSSRSSGSTVTKARKIRPKTRCHYTNDLRCIPSSQNYCCTKSKKATCSKMQTASYIMAHPIKDMDGNLNKNRCKKEKQSDRIKNQIDHKVLCVYRTEIKPGTNTPCYDHHVTCIYTNKATNNNADNDDSIYVKETEKLHCKTKAEFDAMKDEMSDDYFDANSDSVSSIDKSNTDNDVITDVDYGDYVDYISRKTCACKSKTEIKKFMEACALVFDEFSDILFDAVTSENNVGSEINTSHTTLTSIGR